MHETAYFDSNSKKTYKGGESGIGHMQGLSKKLISLQKS